MMGYAAILKVETIDENELLEEESRGNAIIFGDCPDKAAKDHRPEARRASRARWNSWALRRCSE